MRKLFYFISLFTFFLGSLFIYEGFDKKMNYQKPKRYSNSYVGGDAYNYIINSNYFTGYNVLGMGCYVVTILSLTSAAILKSLEEKQEQEKQFYDYIREHPMFNNSGKKAANNVKQKDEGFSIGEWGQLPNISVVENKDHSNLSQATSKNTSESPQPQKNYNSGQNFQQAQDSQHYSYPYQPMSNEQWARTFSQNIGNNSSIQNFNNGQFFGNISAQNPQNDNFSGFQGNNTNNLPNK